MLPLRLLILVAVLAPASLAQEHFVPFKLSGAGDKATRVSITAMGDDANVDVKAIVPERTTLRKTSRGAEYFYVDGDFELKAADKPVRISFSRGIESIPQSLILNSETKASAIDVEPRRWIDMAARQWYSGDSHIHINTGGPIRATINDALLAGRAEGVNYLNLCVSNNLGDDLRDADRVTGRLEPESTPRVLLSYGEEMRSSIYGHMQFFGIRRIVLPQYTGFDNTPNHLDYPANYTLAREATEQGGVVTYGHPMLKNSPDAFGTKLTEANGAARELPIDAALGMVQAMDLMSYNCDKHLSSELWYRLLNAGIKLSACVGTDALLDQSTDPLGGARVYAHVTDELSIESWLSSLKQGRTFVTNGPMLELTIDDKLPGDTLSLATAQEIHLRIELNSWVAVNTLEVIVNGKVAKEMPVMAPNDLPYSLSLPVDLPIAESSWIALRVRGADHESLFDGPAWAHTSPIYVELAGKPIRIAEDRAYFVQWIEQMIRVVNTRNRYPNDKAREEVVALFRQAQDFYR